MIALTNWKIRNIVLILMISSGLVLTAIATVLDYHIHRKVMIKSIDDRLYDAAVFYQHMLPPDFHDQVIDQHSIPPEEFDQIVERNNRLCEQLGLKYIWSLMLVNGEPVFTTSTSSDKQLSNGNYARFFEKHSNPELYTEVFQTMEPHYQVSEDKWGKLRVALVPYLDSHGRKYLLGASMKLSSVETYVSSLWKYTILIMSILIIPSILFMIYLSKRLSAPISLLANTAKIISSGDYSQPIKVSGSHETNVVSKQMEAMRTSVLDHVNKLNKSISEIRSFEQIVSNSPIIVYRLRFEPGVWPVEFISENIDLLGYSAESLMRDNISWNSINYANDLPAIEEKIQAFVKSGQDVFRIESKLVTSDAEPRFMECWNRFVRNEEGTITHIHGLMADITELEEVRQKEAVQHQKIEQMLNDLQAFESVVNASPFTAFKLNVRNDFNAEFVSENISLAGYSAKDIMDGKIEFSSLVPDDALLKLRERFTEALEQGEDTYTCETQIRWASGEIHPYRNSYRIIKDDKGVPLYLQGLSADLTEEKAALRRETSYLRDIEKNIRELEDLRSTVDASPVLIYQSIANSESTPVYLSRNYESLGYPLEDLYSGKITWYDIIPKDDIIRTKELAQHAMDTGDDSYSAELRFRRADGEVVRYQSWNQILRDKDGAPVYFRGILTDITEQTATHQTLQDLYSAVIGSDVHIYRVKLDDNMTTEFVSDNYADMGYAPEDILSGKIKWEDIIYPDDFEQSQKILIEELEKGSESYTTESRLIWADKNIHWYRTWNRFIKNDEGVPVAIQGIAMDITGLKNAHAETLKHQQILKETIKDLDQFYQLVTVSPVIAFRNKLENNFPAVMLTSNINNTGYTAEDFLSGSRIWADLIPHEHYLIIENSVWENAANGVDNFSIEFPLVWKNGSIHWYHSWHNIIRDKHGTATHIQGLISEITELKDAHARDLQYQKRLKKLAQELVQAEDKERQDLAYILHDDIGQMLAGLNMKLSALQEAGKDQDTTELYDQITELLSRIMKTTKTLTWEISPTSLYETDIAAGLERMAADLQKFFDLDIKIETAGVRIELDRDTSALIFRMTKELLVNIAKHSGTHTAEVGISQYNDKVHMVVSDPGTGFDMGKLSEGKGYGLFSIKEHLENINGSMHIDSILGEGTKILMIIPMDISTLN